MRPPSCTPGDARSRRASGAGPFRGGIRRARRRASTFRVDRRRAVARRHGGAGHRRHAGHGPRRGGRAWNWALKGSIVVNDRMRNRRRGHLRRGRRGADKPPRHRRRRAHLACRAGQQAGARGRRRHLRAEQPLTPAPRAPRSSRSSISRPLPPGFTERRLRGAPASRTTPWCSPHEPRRLLSRRQGHDA